MQALLNTSLPFKNIKRGIWLYFILLIFEGGLRKWVFPSLASPLLIIRDPVALYLLFSGFRYGFFQKNVYVNSIWIISFISFVMTILFGHGNMYVALYGIRIMALHFPLIFVIGKVMNKNDVELIGKYVLYLNIFMTILVAIQFYSPQNAWVNRGVGGDLEGSGFGGAEEFFRVPGTFSFTNGLSSFYGFSTSFIFYFLFNNNKKLVPKWLLLTSTGCLLAAIPLSISRTVFFQVIFSLIFLAVVLGRNARMLINLIAVSVFGILLVLILNNFSFFQTATNAFVVRFTSANEVEGGVKSVFLDRFLGGMIQALKDENSSFWGKGLGLGTNVGAQLISGTRGFLVSEGEWGRLIGEQGLFLGFITIFIRCALCIFLLQNAWKATLRNNFLPWMLLSFASFYLLQGQWAQPTSLGFGVLSVGLIMASLNDTPKYEDA